MSNRNQLDQWLIEILENLEFITGKEFEGFKKWLAAVIRRTGKLDPHQVDEIVSDVLLKLATANIRLHALGANSATAFVIDFVRKTAMSFFRARARSQRNLPSESFSSDENPITEVPAPSDAVIDEPNLDALKAILPQLKDEEQDLLRRRFWLNQRVAEIAEELNCERGAVYQRYFRLYAKIRKLLLASEAIGSASSPLQTDESRSAPSNALLEGALS